MVKMQNLVPFCRRTFGVGTPPPPRWQCAGSCSSFARFRVFGLALLHSMFSKPIFSNFLVPPSLATWWKCKSWWHGSGTPPPPRRWQCAGSCSSFGEGSRWPFSKARPRSALMKSGNCPKYLHYEKTCPVASPLDRLQMSNSFSSASERSLFLTADIRL